MSQITIPQALDLALQHHQAGRLAEAESIYRHILATDPNHPDALHLLGVLAYQSGNYSAAVDLIGRAIALKPDFPEALSNLGNALKDLHHPDEAVAAYRKALALNPDFIDALVNLGNVYRDLWRLDEAIAEYQKALALAPNLVDAHSNLGAALKDRGHLSEAIAACQHAVELRPDDPNANSNLAAALLDSGQFEEAIAACRKTLTLVPEHFAARKNLGLALVLLGQPDEAIINLNQALNLLPNTPAENQYRADLYNCLARAFLTQARLDEALIAFHQAIDLAPKNPAFHSHYLFTLPFHPDQTAESLYRENLRWNQLHAAPLASEIRPHPNDRSPGRRLRIGYVSPNFCSHCQSFFTLPLFLNHDHHPFEIFCYSDGPKPDAITERLKSCTDHWHNTVGLPDRDLAELIRRDQIDILVDLTLHMAGSRLLTFARKPAPIQVAWLAYPGTTGLTAMDYRLTDPHLDPPGLFDAFCTEQTFRLPDTFWCYFPLTKEPPVNSLPALARGHITFGCFNNFTKINPRVLQLWARVLNAVPRSRLMLLADVGSHRQHVLQLLQQAGITSDRIDFVSRQSRPKYLELYHSVDLCLDTFPSNGHTTSLDSYWMGVPVITFVGPTHVGRAGLSQLTNLHLTDLIAHTPDQFVQIATALVQDLPRLAQLRSNLRQRMESSPLMDAPKFARAIESAYRTMWHRYCSFPLSPPTAGTPDGNPGHSHPP